MDKLSTPEIKDTRVFCDLKIIGHETEIVEFLRVCGAIQYLGRIGSCRAVKVIVDGDGSGRLEFSLNGESLPSTKKAIDAEEDVVLHIGE